MYIPKADGRQWPQGIATLEDKILQRAVVEVLNAVPGRGATRIRRWMLVTGIKRKNVNRVLDADIRDFFGQLDRSWLRKGS